MGFRSRIKDARLRPIWVVGLFLLPLLGSLLYLQSTWLDELASAQQEEARRVLASAAERVVTDVQSALADLESSLLRDAVDANSHAWVLEVVDLDPEDEVPSHVPAFVLIGPQGRRRLVVLDVERLEEELFPVILRDALGSNGLATYRVDIVAANGQDPALFSSLPHHDRPGTTPDASADLHLLPNRWRSFFAEEGESWTEIEYPTLITEADTDLYDDIAPSHANWRVEIRHRAGSLALALSRTRRRNLLLGAGILLLLVAGLGLLWFSEQRARRLAEQELAFVAGVSHELRTPLTVVRTAASNLEKGVVSDPTKVREYGALIEDEVARVSTLVERVLRLSEEEERPLVVEPIDIEAWIAKAIERCAPWRDRRQFEVAVEVAEDARSLEGDAAALTSALHNLIENAIKYGPDKHSIRIEVHEADGVRVEVTDQGPGVAAEDRARIFHPFFRGAGVRHGNIPGSGLGLSVARDIARAHGGKLELVASASGTRGATFALHLPRSSSE